MRGHGSKVVSAARTVPRKIRVVFGRNPPDVFSTCHQFPTFAPSVDCPFPGWTMEIITMIADFLKIEVEPVILDDNIGNINWGYNNNGNWTGVLGMIQAGRADTMCVLVQYIADHSKHFSYSNPVTSMRDVYITHPKRKSISMSLWNAFFPYEFNVWALILLALLVQGSLGTFIAKVECKLNLRHYFLPSERFWHYLRLHIRQTTEYQVPFFLKSGNLSFILYAIMQATLFTNLYTAVILSALIRGENPQPWDSFTEMVSLIKSGEYSIVIDKLDYDEGSFLQMLTYTNISQLRNLHDAVKKNPIVIARNVFEALDYVERGGYIFPTRQDSLALQLSKERCNLFYSEDDNSQQPVFFIFSKNNPLISEWNRAIRDNQPFIRRTYDKYFMLGYRPGAIPHCAGSTYDIPEASRPLDIISTFGIFMIVMVGFGMAIIVFLFELYVDWYALNLRLQQRTRQAMLTAPTHLLAIVRLLARTNHEHVIQTFGTDFPSTCSASQSQQQLQNSGRSQFSFQPPRRKLRCGNNDPFDVILPSETMTIRSAASSTSLSSPTSDNVFEEYSIPVPPPRPYLRSRSQEIVRLPRSGEFDALALAERRLQAQLRNSLFPTSIAMLPRWRFPAAHPQAEAPADDGMHRLQVPGVVSALGATSRGSSGRRRRRKRSERAAKSMSSKECQAQMSAEDFSGVPSLNLREDSSTENQPSVESSALEDLESYGKGRASCLEVDPVPDQNVAPTEDSAIGDEGPHRRRYAVRLSTDRGESRTAL